MLTVFLIQLRNATTIIHNVLLATSLLTTYVFTAIKLFHISAAKDFPHPQVCVALGFEKEKPPPIKASL